MIDYPSDEAVIEQAQAHGIPTPVLIRDLVRIVEVLNLREKRFFNERSVLAGSMALRSFGSPRFTVYDADFSTSKDTVSPATAMRRLLAYEDDELTISPSALVPHDQGGTAWKSAPIDFAPAFTGLVPNDDDRHFKADISFRGLIRDGREEQLKVPYDLAIWSEPPTVFVMDPVEIVAEKILGWCVNELVKHYADLAFIALVSQSGPSQRLILNPSDLRGAVADKLEAMRELQPETYEAFRTVDDVRLKLAADPDLDEQQWLRLVYIRSHRDRFTKGFVQRAVQELLVPLLGP